MEENKDQYQEYDTTIKDLGGIKDVNLFFKAIELYFSTELSLHDSLVINNDFDIRTVKTRKKTEWALNKTILKFLNKDHEQLLYGIIQPDVPFQDKALALFWQFALNNKLFREISINVFTKIYFSGRASISNDEIIAFIKEQSHKSGSESLQWSEETIYRIATKYLNLMSKLSFVSEGRNKSFIPIRPSLEVQILFLYFTQLFTPQNRDILGSSVLPLCFIAAEDIHNRLKKISTKGYFNMDFNGINLNIELIHGFKGICDVLYHRS
jgi:hypothetical protein